MVALQHSTVQHRNGGGAHVSATDLRMEYNTPAGRVNALDGVTLEISPESSMAIVGPSGCGKSTLLGILGGLELPTRGEVRIDDSVISAMPERPRAQLRRTSFGYVFQEDNLQPFLTVSENVAVQAVLAGIADDPERDQRLLDALEVGSLGHRFPDQLSGGQRQRVAVARALVHGPRVVLADEPTGSLDAASSNKVVDLLLRLHKQEGTTLVIVTHDSAVAARMDATVHMRDGRVTVAQGTRS
jgi:putative ABC transport system ATP-binding protein